MELDNHLSTAYTKVELSCADRKGLLFDLMRTLKDINIRVAYGAPPKFFFIQIMVSITGQIDGQGAGRTSSKVPVCATRGSLAGQCSGPYQAVVSRCRDEVALLHRSMYTGSVSGPVACCRCPWRGGGGAAAMHLRPDCAGATS